MPKIFKYYYGTYEGGAKAGKTNIARHGKDYYKRIGAIGGRKSTTGGFASNKVGKDGLTGRQRSRVAGRKGGKKSRRGKTLQQDTNGS